ncbi:MULTISPECIES: hypothetical protein [Clostridium]|uniref:hypothetical protein n=1 Tax=Clostridium TaxID=1485 RepID=UPI00039A093E|nr:MULTISPECIES: hypothetical protein [Clostridium]MBZ5748178.1 hypothetical protein [Clostridium butyricum]MDI9210407.1 hypothetical protein [Clostridium butyricum]MDU2894888.1 hypothetical protein [Clostridium sp.]MDU3007181.1 hypothetical protein [Clostridium sp.]MDU3037069.1 hypothetical protein [Clostridium sp.]
MSISKKLFDTINNNEKIYIYTLENSTKIHIKNSNYDGTIVSCMVPDKSGNLIDVLLGYDNLNSYLTGVH